MFVTACLLVTFGIVVCLLACRASLRLLGLQPMEMLVWLGLAEVPAPPAPRRRLSA